MVILGMAWDNLFYNAKRTALTVCLLGIALAGVILFIGYLEQGRQSQMKTLLDATGHLQAARRTYWDQDDEEEGLLTGDDLDRINAALSQTAALIKAVPTLSITGIAGRDTASTRFFALAYDNPAEELAEYTIVEGSPVLADEQGIGLGTGLARKLKAGIGDTIQIMASTEEGGIALSGFEVMNITDSGSFIEDQVRVIMPRKAALNFLGLEDGASYVKIYLSHDTHTEAVQAALTEALGSEFQLKSWREINPSFESVEREMRRQITTLTLILCILILFVIAQVLASAFNERLNEYGTLESIGLKKRGIIFLLGGETVFLSLLGIGLGLLCTAGAQIYSAIAPDSLRFIIQPLSLFLVCVFICIVCLISAIVPIALVLRNSAVRLMHRP